MDEYLKVYTAEHARVGELKDALDLIFRLSLERDTLKLNEAKIAFKRIMFTSVPLPAEPTGLDETAATAMETGEDSESGSESEESAPSHGGLGVAPAPPAHAPGDSGGDAAHTQALPPRQALAGASPESPYVPLKISEKAKWSEEELGFVQRLVQDGLMGAPDIATELLTGKVQLQRPWNALKRKAAKMIHAKMIQEHDETQVGSAPQRHPAQLLLFVPPVEVD